MNIVDSSGWLAYFADEPNAKYFLPPLKEHEILQFNAVIWAQDPDFKNMSNVRYFTKQK